MAQFLWTDPCELFLPPSRPDGADPAKLQRQIAKYGTSTEDMPPIECHRWPQGELMIADGVTRATRVAKLLPGTTVRVEITAEVAAPRRMPPRVGERLP